MYIQTTFVREHGKFHKNPADTAESAPQAAPGTAAAPSMPMVNERMPEMRTPMPMMSRLGAGTTAEPRQRMQMMDMCMDLSPETMQKMMQHGMQGGHK